MKEQLKYIIKKPLTLSQTNRVLLVFLAIMLGLLYSNQCRVSNESDRVAIELGARLDNHSSIISRQIVQRDNEDLRNTGIHTAIGKHINELEDWQDLIEEVHRELAADLDKNFRVIDTNFKDAHKDITKLQSRQIVNQEVFKHIYANTSLAFPLIIKKAIPAIVGISREGRNPDDVLGTGFIYDKTRGLILTAKHVLSAVAGSQGAVIRMPDGKRVPVLTVVSHFTDDVSLLIVDTDHPNWKPQGELKLADSNGCVRGQIVINLGHPFGALNMASAGIISNAEIIIDDIVLEGPRLSYDAVGNPGSSGGAVINMSGEVVAMHVATICVINQSSGVGLGVPVETIQELLESCEEWL